MIHRKLPNNAFKYVFHLGNLFMILTGLRIKRYIFKKYKLNCLKLKKNESTLKIALKLPKSPYFFQFLGKNLS